MSEWITIAALNDVPEGTGKEVAAAGRVFAIYNVGGEIHVLDGICPHAGGPLGQGVLSGCVVTCPWHGWQLDVSTGRHCLTETIQQPRFPVRIENAQILVEV